MTVSLGPGERRRADTIVEGRSSTYSRAGAEIDEVAFGLAFAIADRPLAPGAKRKALESCLVRGLRVGSFTTRGPTQLREGKPEKSCEYIWVF